MRARGFTLIELLVVLAIIATLLTLASPRYFAHVDKAREEVLREDLYLMRDAIDKFYMDRGNYPATLDELVTHKYLRAIPVDPFTNSRKTWIVEAPQDGSPGAVFNVRAPTAQKGRDGTAIKDW